MVTDISEPDTRLRSYFGQNFNKTNRN